MEDTKCSSSPLTTIRLFYITAETWPNSRVDVSVLFGKYLPRLGIHSDLITGQTPGEPAQPWGGGEARLVDIGGQTKKHLKTFLHIWRELRRIDAGRYHAIQVRDLPLPAALALWTAQRKGLPFFYWMSYPMPLGQIALARERGLSEGLMKFLFPWVRGRVGRFLLYQVVLPRADHVFVQSERMRQDLIALGIEAEKMTPVPMGVDLEAMEVEAIPPAEDPHLKGRRVLVYLGTLDRPRRIELLFDMLARVRKEIPEALLLLVGDTHDDSHRAWLKAQTEKAGVAADVIWTGWLPMRESWRYVRAAEVGLSPIPRGPLLDGGSPTKVPEYLALGVPVVGNDNPDQQVIIEASGAGRCVPYTAEDFARAVLELLRLSPQERQAMAQRGKELVARERDYPQLAAKVEERYRTMLCDKQVKSILLGPSLAAVSGVSTHLNRLFGSALAQEFELMHFQVGSQGRNEKLWQKLARFAFSPLNFFILLLRQGPTIVHINSSLDQKSYWRDLAYLFAAKLLRRPVVYQVHGGALPEEFFGGNFLLTRFLRWSLQLPEVMVVLAQVQFEAYRRFLPGQWLEMVPNAIEPAVLLARPLDRPPQGPLRLAYLSRLVENKGIFEAVEALSLLCAQGRQVTLDIAGDGPDEARLRERVSAAGLDGIVRFHGPLFGPAKDALWRNTDIFVFPTYHREGLPYALLEAMAAGAVPVTTRVGAMPDVMQDGVHGLFVEPHDAAGVAKAIARLDDDRVQCLQMAQAARRRVIEHYTVARLAEDFARIYLELSREGR